MRELKHVRGLGYILTLEQTTSQDLNILTSYAVSVKKKKGSLSVLQSAQVQLQQQREFREKTERRAVRLVRTCLSSALLAA